MGMACVVGGLWRRVGVWCGVRCALQKPERGSKHGRQDNVWKEGKSEVLKVNLKPPTWKR